MKHIKSETIAEICQLTAGVIAALCIGAIVGLVLLILAGLIPWWMVAIYIALITIVGVLDAAWIDKHFVDGEWV